MVKSLAAQIAVIAITLLSAKAAAGVVSDVTGTIDLELKPFFEYLPGTHDDPTTSQLVSIPIGMGDTSASIDGTGYYSVGGLSSVDYAFTKIGKSEARLDFQLFAGTEGRSDGGGGSAAVQMDVTFPAPVYFRLEADAYNAAIHYDVSFNDVSAYASYDAYFGGYYGTFPIKYYYENGVPVIAYGWETYIHEGILPAGTYHLSSKAYSAIHGRYGVGLGSEGSASLYVRLLGDVNGNGRVGIEDINRVLSHWNRTQHKDHPLTGDLDGDGIVGITDLNWVLAGWGSDLSETPSMYSAIATPEPLSGTLMVALLPVLLRRNRHADQ